MNNYDNGDFEGNLKIGKYHEELVLAWAKSKKYNCKLYSSGNGKAQIKVYKGKTYIHPDIEVFTDSSGIKIKMLIEVKSFSQKYLMRDSYFRNLFGHKVEESEYGFPIKCRNFNSYYSIYEDYGIDVRCVFCLEDESQWWWQKINKMYETKNYEQQGFGKGIPSYFWYLKDLRTDF